MPQNPQGVIRTQSLKLQPVLRLPDFLREQKSPMPCVEEMRELHVCLEEWTERLVCLRLGFAVGALEQEAEKDLLLVYLPEAVERHIAEIWQRSPAQGHLLHNLAQHLCRAAVALALPEVGVSGCTPLPRLTPVETNLLREFISEPEPGHGVQKKFSFPPTGIGRVYSILTYYSSGGGCGQCALNEYCPRLCYC